MASVRDFELQQYNAAHSSVGFVNLASRGKLQLTGPDRISFFHALITNEVEGVSEWSGRYGALLTARGRIVSDFFYYKLPAEILVDLPPGVLENVVQILDSYIVMDEVELNNVSAEWNHCCLVGPQSQELLTHLFPEYSPQKAYGVQELEWEDSILRVITKHEISSSHFELLSPSHRAPYFREVLLERGRSLGIMEVQEGAWKTLRLEAGIPQFGVDMDGSRYPMEARMTTAISLTKGCFVGQEVVAKATHVGGVNNLLMGLKLKGDRVPDAGSGVFDESGKQVGAVTSAAFSPMHGCAVALAYIRSFFASPGNLCKVQMDRETEIPAEVVERLTNEHPDHGNPEETD